MSTHIKKQGGVIFAMVALPFAVLIAPLLIALFAAFISSLSMSLP
jgi:hypothetical protein